MIDLDQSNFQKKDWYWSKTKKKKKIKIHSWGYFPFSYFFLFTNKWIKLILIPLSHQNPVNIEPNCSASRTFGKHVYDEM